MDGADLESDLSLEVLHDNAAMIMALFLWLINQGVDYNKDSAYLARHDTK